MGVKVKSLKILLSKDLLTMLQKESESNDFDTFCRIFECEYNSDRGSKAAQSNLVNEHIYDIARSYTLFLIFFIRMKVK